MKIHNTTDQFWVDEAGISIPFSRIEECEKLKERTTGKILKEAYKINESLAAFKKMLIEQTEKTFKADLKAGKVAEGGKGNYTLHSFDRSVKIEVKINEQIVFDENLIGAAKEKFETFLKEGTSGVDDMIRQLILDAFSSGRKTKFDTKKILGLLGYRIKINAIKYPEFHEALDLIEQAITRPSSKTYYRVWVKDNQGEYQNVDLNLSSI